MFITQTLLPVEIRYKIIIFIWMSYFTGTFFSLQFFHFSFWALHWTFWVIKQYHITSHHMSVKNRFMHMTNTVHSITRAYDKRTHMLKASKLFSKIHKKKSYFGEEDKFIVLFIPKSRNVSSIESWRFNAKWDDR